MGLSTQLKEASSQMPRVIKCPGAVLDLAPATAGRTLWTIQNEPILVRYIFGVITQACTGAARPFLQLVTTAAFGAPTTTAICALSAVLNGVPAGTVLQMDGATAGILTAGAVQGGRSCAEATGVWGVATGSGDFVLMVPGVIQIVNATSAGATGLIDWYMYYIPGGPNSRVTVR